MNEVNLKILFFPEPQSQKVFLFFFNKNSFLITTTKKETNKISLSEELINIK